MKCIHKDKCGRKKIWKLMTTMKSFYFKINIEILKYLKELRSRKLPSSSSHPQLPPRMSYRPFQPKFFEPTRAYTKEY